MKLQKFPILAAAILGALSVSPAALARGGGFAGGHGGGGGAHFVGGGGARFAGGGGVRFAGGAVGGARFAAPIRAGGGFAAVHARAFPGRAFAARPAFVGERFNRFARFDRFTRFDRFARFDRFHRFHHFRNFGGVAVAAYPYAYDYPYYSNYPYYQQSYPYAYNAAPYYSEPYAAPTYAAAPAYTSAGYAEYTPPPPVAAYEPAAVAAQCPAPIPGDVVANVQRVLRSRGYYCGPIDGVSGPATRAAIRAYDNAVGLPVCGGVIDSTLLRSLGLM